MYWKRYCRKGCFGLVCLVFSCTAFAAPLPDGTLLTIEPSTDGCITGSCLGADCIGKTVLGTWHWSVNGVVVPLGSADGCQSSMCYPDPASGIFFSRWEVTAEGRYVLEYANHVPEGHASGFGNVYMPTRLEGDIILPLPEVSGFWPTAGEPGDFIFVFGEHFELPVSNVSVNGLPPLMQHTVNENLVLFAVPFGDVGGPVSVTTAVGTGISSFDFGSPTRGLANNGIWPASGLVGTIVFIFGNGFDFTSLISVTMGGVSSVYHVIDSTAMLMMIPEGAVSGPITVNTTAGTVSSGEFTVTP